MPKKAVHLPGNVAVQLVVIVWLLLGFIIGLMSRNDALVAGYGKLYVLLLVMTGWLFFVLVRRWR